MDINKMNIVTAEEEETIKFEWPQAYYLPTDGKLRKVALDRAIVEGLEPENDKIRMEIWERRYGKPGVDEFLAGYMSLSYYATAVKGSFMARFHKKDMKETQEKLCYDIPGKYGKAGEDMLYLELYHMVDYYIEICLKDKKYGGLVMGIGSMKRENLINKIASDICRVCYGIPSGFEVLPTHKLLQKAGVQCFYDHFPESRNIIDEKIS